MLVPYPIEYQKSWALLDGGAVGYHFPPFTVLTDR